MSEHSQRRNADSRAPNTEQQPRAVEDNDISGVIDTYRAYTYSLLPAILKKALLTPSSLWMRALLLPAFAFYLTYRPESLVPWAAALATLAAVPLIVAGFIFLQLHIIIRKGTETDLSDNLLRHFSESGSRFFVISVAGRVLGLVGVRNRTGGQAELLYFAVRPGLPNRDALADALLAAAVPHARRAGFEDLIVKLNSAEVGLLGAVGRAGFGKEQLIRINAWFQAHRLMITFKKQR